MPDLTVVCVFVTGPYPYTADYVVRLERMARRYLDRPFRFVCLTDRAKALPRSIETIAVTPPDVPANGRGFWTKVQLFRPDLGLTGRVLFLDLDTLVVAPLAPIVDYPSAFALTADAVGAHLATADRFGRRIVRKFNSSVMVWQAGEQVAVFEDWTPAVADRLSTDQDWIAEHMPSAEGMPHAWFPRISRQQPPWAEETKVVLVKKPKNHVACTRWPWFEPLWGGWTA